jgi:hypothetical protein
MVVTLGVAVLGGCTVLTVRGLTGRAVLLPEGEGLPENDIVFIPEETPDTLGFINADGTGFETRTLEMSEGFFRDFVKMSTLGLSVWVTWGPEGRSLAGSLGRFHTGGGIPVVITSDGGLLYCPEDESTPDSTARSWIVDGSTILTIDEYPSGDPELVLLMDMTTCAVREVLYQIPQDLNLEEASISLQGWLAITTLREASLSEREAFRRILLIDPQGAEVAEVPNGRWPSWSQDGEWLAYTVNDDGLYIVRRDGTEPRKVLAEPRVGLATWSPDGEWLAYDRPTGEGNQAIYKVNLTSGEEVEIFRGGFNPNWSWRQSD